MIDDMQFTELDHLVGEYSDAYKDIHGIRPRWMKFNSVEEVEAALDELHRQDELQAAYDKHDEEVRAHEQQKEREFQTLMPVPGEREDLSKISGMGRRFEGRTASHRQDALLRIYIRDLLFESYAMTRMSIPEAVDYLTSLEGRNFIFFDTETLGFTPKHQLIQVAAMVVPIEKWGSSPKIMAEFDEKAQLTATSLERLSRPPKMKKKRRKDKDYAELLQMTQYYENGEAEKTEEEVISDFIDFCSKVDNPVYAAHNAKFDMRMFNARAKLYGLPGLPVAKVLDTLQVIKFFVKPALKSALEDTEMQRIAKATTHRGRFSAKLGNLAAAMNISIDNWHNAKADVEMMFKVIGDAVTLVQATEQYDVEAAAQKSQKERDTYVARRSGRGPQGRKTRGQKRHAAMGRETY